MKKQISFILCGLSFSMGAMAASLTPEQALQRLNTPGMQKIGGRDGVTRDLVYTAKTLSGDPAVYVFENSGKRGYMLLSADDAAAPILGYSDSGSFDPKTMPEQMKWWIEEYGRQIEYARANNIPAYSAQTRAEDRKAVAPLLKTKWNQTEPYDAMTPVIGGVQSPTGCVATAVAQVMKYWQYPEVATGTGTISNPVDGGTLSMALGEEPFAWDKMLNSYSGAYTDEQAHAVAYLMKAVGYASQMKYGQYSSGAFSYIAGLALMDNFGYNPDIEYCTRNYYGADEWEEMIYNEVANGRPVIYGGQSTSVGHEFVCDGYNGDGYFHFNWGWSGMGDGYFLLNSLNPNALGTGGGSGGGYNYAQDVLVGVQPKKEQVVMPNLVQFGALEASVSGLNVELSVVDSRGLTCWFNTGMHSVVMALGLAVESLETGEILKYESMGSYNVEAPEWTVGTSLQMAYAGITGQINYKMPITYADGKYRLTVVFKPSGSDQWTPALTMPQYYNYVEITKTGNKLAVDALPEASITLDSAEAVSAIYYGMVAKMKIKATNNSDKELTQGFYPELFSNEQEEMLGDGIVLTIPAHATVEEEFVTTFRLLNGASAPTTKRMYQLGWYDPVNRKMYDIVEDITMDVVSGNPSVTVESFDIAGVTPKPNQEYDALYTVENDEAEFNLTLTNKRGFFGYPIYVLIFKMDGSGDEVMRASFEPLLTLTARETGETTAVVNVSSLPKNKVYAAAIWYQGPKGLTPLDDNKIIFFEVAEGAGVDIIGVDETPVKYYNLQGVEVANPAKGQLLIKKQGTKTQKVIY